MKVLLDTNIIIHREAAKIINEDIGILFRWFDTLHYQKCVHPVTVGEIQKYKDNATVKCFQIKLENYSQLRTTAPLHKDIIAICSPLDVSDNDVNDSILVNEAYSNRVDILITEDKKIQHKAALLNIQDKVFTIERFLESVTAENPTLTDYKVLSVKQELFGNISLDCSFFDSFKADYPGFENWYNRKSEETAYICKSNDTLLAFLYVKPEGRGENYTDIVPPLPPKRRLKIGTFKVELNGYKLGERFLKIVFDNAITQKIEEIYVTIFDHTLEHQRLIDLLIEYGFRLHGYKLTGGAKEHVYVRDFTSSVNPISPKTTFPYISAGANHFLVAIYPSYHTELLPDSILKTESPAEFVENEPHRNAISKVFISRSIERALQPGDTIIFYRTAGPEGNAYYRSVITTLGIVESICTDIRSEEEFIRLCGKRSVFTRAELKKHWNYRQWSRPFIVNFLCVHSFKKRLNLKALIDLNILSGTDSAPRGFLPISRDNFNVIIRETQTDECIVVN